MITFILVIALAAEPMPTFGLLRGFDTMKECQTFIKEVVKPEHRARTACWAVVKGHIVEV